MGQLKIRDVQVHLTQPGGACLVVVKVLTNEPELYGLGCATFTQRHQAVAAAINHHVGPFVVGKDPRDIEDLWRSSTYNSYWRHGPVLNNAICGIDMALWDIKGKLARMPCYQLWGGKCRAAVPVYGHAGGRNGKEVLNSARKFIKQGYRYIRCQLQGYAGAATKPWPREHQPGVYFAPREKMTSIPALFDFVRHELGDEIELLHDIHERLAPQDAVWLAKALEPYRLFFLEDLLPLEQTEWFENVRNVCTTPLAFGELFSNPAEIKPLVTRRLIDFVRCHISSIGGVTPALKLIHFCDAFGVRTAWHGPGDVSPVGMMANVHLDLAAPNFGIQEWSSRTEAEAEVFPGLPAVENGLVYANEKPGWGIGFNEKLAKKYPCDEVNPMWTVARLADGTLWSP